MAKKSTPAPAVAPTAPAVVEQPTPTPAPVAVPEPVPPAPSVAVPEPEPAPAPEPVVRAKAYTTPTEGAKPMRVVRSDRPELELVDSFVDSSEAIRCYIIQHGAGPSGSKFAFTPLE